MGIVKVNFNTDALAAAIEQVGKRAERAILAAMREEAEKIKELASSYAPRDDSELDQAIEVGEDRGGINGRTRVFVYVDPDARDNKGARIADYGLRMHEGVYNLGKKSRDKDGGRGVVGPKYMERALRQRRGVLGKKAAEAARKAI